MSEFTWPPGKRAPCGGWITPLSKAMTIGDLHQHYDATIAAVAKRHNVTKDFNPDCTPECCDRSGASGPCPAEGTAPCPPACPGSEPLTTFPVPRDACLDGDGNGTTATGCGPCGPDLATYLIGATFTQGNCATATLPPVPCPDGSTQIGDNCYSAPDSEDTKDFSSCRFIGFKNLIAYKQWHGALPFGVDCYERDSDATGCGDSGGANPCPPKGFYCMSKPNTPTNSATKKYLSAKLEISVTMVSGDGLGIPHRTYTSSYSCTNTVDRMTGKVTRVATASASNSDSTNADGSTNSDGGPVAVSGFPTLLNLLARCTGNYSGDVTDCGGSGGEFGAGTVDITVTGDYKMVLTFTGVRTSWEVWVANDDPGHFTVEPVPYTLDESFDPSFWTDTGRGFENYSDCTITWTLGDGSGGGAYTSDDVMADIEALMATWDFEDHALYPPRTDAVTNGGPLMTYNERTETDAMDPDFDPDTGPWINPVGTGFVSTDGGVTYGQTVNDSRLPKFPSRVEGSMVGTPLPVGSEPYVDFYHEVWDLDNPDGAYGYNVPKSYRQISTSAAFYCPHMTMWTDERHHKMLPHGPFVFCQALGLDSVVGATLFLPHYKEDGSQVTFLDMGFKGVWASKWAEVLMFEKPPHNYARPCGAYDAATLNMDSVDCEAEDPLAGATARWLDTVCNCDDDTFVGGVSTVTNATPIVLTCAVPHGLADGDVINICDVKGCTAANGRRSVQVVSADTVELYDADDTSEPIAGNGDYAGGGNVSLNSTGEEDYWNDRWAKGNFIFKQFQYNWRDWYESYRAIMQAYFRTQSNTANAANDSGHGGNCEAADGTLCCPPCPDLTAPDPVRFTVNSDEMSSGAIMEEGNENNGGSKWLQSVSCNQYCVVHSPCAPCLVYVQPSSENEGIGADGTDKAIDMPYFSGSLKLDWNYGTLWIGRVEQWMPDPLWTPYGNGHELLKCGTGAGEDTVCDRIAEDDGSCTPDHEEEGLEICTFPQRPYEEAECSPPEDAPDLPDGSRVMGCADFIANLNLPTPVVNGQDIAPNVPDCGSPYYFTLYWSGTNYFMQAAGPDENPMCSPWVPWLWLLNQQGCVAAAGIYAADYKRNGAVAE